MEKSDWAGWVAIKENGIRAGLQQRLDVMYKRVFYDRLRAEGFSSYDGLVLLGTETVMDSGEISSWLEKLITPFKLAPTEGRTYWMNVSEDCHNQVEEITYLEAFIAMRKDFKIDDAGRQKLLRSVLESELEKLSGLSDGQLRGLANLILRDFPKLIVPEASEGLEELLERMRIFPAEGVVERIKSTMANAKKMAALDANEAKGLCSRLATEGEVDLAAKFWVAYLEAMESGGRSTDFGSLNFGMLARKPFMGDFEFS